MKSNQYKQIAKSTIKIEAEALSNLSDCIDERFEHAISLLLQTEGKVIITGIGKSALIGKKIVATLNSTGTTAIFMHAADAIHGDLGLINSNDTIIAISKSGETPELKVLMPIINSFGVFTIAMTSNEKSTLAKQCGAILYTPVKEEADPNNLAPTSSTTVQAAMGDAIATVLLSVKGFSAKDFAKYHPGGSLGKQLYLKVSDIALLDAPPKVHAQDTMKDILIEMSTKRLGATIVVDSENSILGIITDGDVRRFYQEKESTKGLVALDFMSKSPKTIKLNELAFHAFQILRENKINQLAVTDSEGKYKGMIHIHDLLKEGFV